MDIQILDRNFDDVIKSEYILIKTNYAYAIENLVPLINKFEQQRNVLPTNVYKRLEKDIKRGCILPSLTLAIVNERLDDLIQINEDYIINHISNGFVLDGIQRLNVLNKINEKDKEELKHDKPLYINIIISNSVDKLLYRMVTLNNGQKPMSSRHQIEILTDNMYTFDSLPVESMTEKNGKYKRLKNVFDRADVVKAYLAYITSSTNIDNQKIIESKMDELITDNIIKSDIPDRKYEFRDAMNLISEIMIESEYLRKWFKLSNNLIGFCAAVSKEDVFEEIQNENPENLEGFIKELEKAIASLNISKVKIGKVRRDSVHYVIEKYRDFRNYEELELLTNISDRL